MRSIFLMILSSLSLVAQAGGSLERIGQRIQVGFKVGAPLNDPAKSNQSDTRSSTGRWTGGPSIEIRLVKGFSLEFNALYRSREQSSSRLVPFGPNSNPYQFSNRLDSHVWDYPLLLKYRFRLGAMKPFVSAGYQWSNSFSRGEFFAQCSGPQGSCRPAGLEGFIEPGSGRWNFSSSQSGPVLGVGLDFRTRYVTISPEFRASRPTAGVYPRETGYTALVGFSFGKKR